MTLQAPPWKKWCLIKGSLNKPLWFLSLKKAASIGVFWLLRFPWFSESKKVSESCSPEFEKKTLQQLAVRSFLIHQLSVLCFNYNGWIATLCLRKDGWIHLVILTWRNWNIFFSEGFSMADSSCLSRVSFDLKEATFGWGHLPKLWACKPLQKYATGKTNSWHLEGFSRTGSWFGKMAWIR